MRKTACIGIGGYDCRVAEIDMRGYERLWDFLNAGGAAGGLAGLLSLDSAPLRDLAGSLLRFSDPALGPVLFYPAWQILTQGDREAVIEQLAIVNTALIEDLDAGAKKRQAIEARSRELSRPAPTPDELVKQAAESRQAFYENMARLIRIGHVNAWDYGYAFYVACISEWNAANRPESNA